MLINMRRGPDAYYEPVSVMGDVARLYDVECFKDPAALQIPEIQKGEINIVVMAAPHNDCSFTQSALHRLKWKDIMILKETF